MSWKNVPLCDGCWAKREPDRQPYRLLLPEIEFEPCHLCGQPTNGIFVRMEVAS